MNSKMFSHAQKPFSSFLPHVHLSFIGLASYFSELPLEIVIASLFLSAWRKRILTGRTVIFSFWRVRGVFLFPFFSWDVYSFMIRFLLEPICGMSGFSLWVSSCHVSQQCFINCLLFFSFIQIVISKNLQFCSKTLYGFHNIRIQFNHQFFLLGGGIQFPLLVVIFFNVHDLNCSF